MAILYVQVYMVKLVASNNKEYLFERDCINHNDFHIRSFKVNISEGNKIMVFHVVKNVEKQKQKIKG